MLPVRVGQPQLARRHALVLERLRDRSIEARARGITPPADLASAHALAVDYLLAGGERTAFNLGNGLGFSVQQVIDTARAVTGRHINALDAPRRAGDPPRLVADASKALQVLGWRPEFASLEQIVRHAWQWELQYPWVTRQQT